MGRFIKPKAITRKQFYKYLLDNFYISETLAELLAVYAEETELNRGINKTFELHHLLMTLFDWSKTDLGYQFWVNLYDSTPHNLRKPKD